MVYHYLSSSCPFIDMRERRGMGGGGERGEKDREGEGEREGGREREKERDFTAASLKPSLGSSWRMGNAVISRENARRTTSMSGHSYSCPNRWSPAKRDWRKIPA